MELHTVQTARALVQAIDNKIFRVQALAQGLASVSKLAQGDLASFHQQARETLKQANLGVAVILTDAQGQQVLNTFREFGEPLPRSADPELSRRTFETGKPTVSNLFVGASIQKLIMVVGVPVFIDGKVAYALTIPMLPSDFRAILTEQQLPPDWVATVLDGSATIAARTRLEDQYVGKKPRQEFIDRFAAFNDEVYENTTLEGISSLVAFVRSRETGWGIGIAFPLASSQLPLVRHVGFLALGLGILCSIGLLLAWVIAHRIAQSFRAIVGQATALETGETVPMPVVTVREAEEAALAIAISGVLLATRQAALQDSERQFRATFEQAAVGIAHVGLDGRWLRVNQKLCDIVGYSREELVTRTFQDITYPEDLEADLAQMQHLLAGKIPHYSMEKRYLRKDGSLVWINVTAALLRNEQDAPDYFIAVVEDISRRKEVEAEIQVLNADLERRVEERTSELRAANQELEAFTFATSHDLRGPLGRINSFTTLLERNCRSQLEGDNLLFLDLIRQNATRLTQLVDDLLVHARVSQKPLELQSLDVSTVAQAVVREKVPESPNKDVQIHMNLVPARIKADSQALDQVLGNLVENALKYSSKVECPLVEIGGEVVEGRYRLRVRDNGIGFDMKYHDKIFQMFQRLHTYTEYQGSGVGLALVGRAMHRMGGKVWAESEPGKGATFFLEFQLSANP